MSAPAPARPRPAAGPLAALATGVAVTLAGSVAVQVSPAWQVQAGVGVPATVVLFALARVCRERPSADALLALGALSVFGWVSALVTAVPAVSTWLGTVAVPVAFLVVNSMKLSSVAVLVVLARRNRWSRHDLLVRRGTLNAPTGIPGLRWGLAGPVVIVAVLALFLSDPAVTGTGLAGVELVELVLPWAPVMLAGSLVNAVSEELLYRHALIATASRLLGTGTAVVMSCLVFGLGHITGSPGGLTGVLATAVYGLVCAAAMLGNRGMTWNLVIHVFGDLGAVTALLVATQG
ncbi:CPBP family intramembrane glutamic endopeptidase [Prauserella cavernicola]|uniref:CPBP family intramembrane metalloprotease n=1 Tax=Prauserella cavernicola TaxID=2800127 RepID=A0A934QWG5_9PSEU|nr:CPBP family intramembrane glutamic endopeptidase [Prauserella cavernicola]MBK1787681.1 CPBP family intramembrane metalloprotease [Prauserella cavernicola]